MDNPNRMVTLRFLEYLHALMEWMESIPKKVPPLFLMMLKQTMTYVEDMEYEVYDLRRKVQAREDKLDKLNKEIESYKAVSLMLSDDTLEALFNSCASWLVHHGYNAWQPGKYENHSYDGFKRELSALALACFQGKVDEFGTLFDKTFGAYPKSTFETWKNGYEYVLNSFAIAQNKR